MIDFQRDFCAAGGYSDRFAGLDWVQPIIAPARRLLDAARRAGLWWSTPARATRPISRTARRPSCAQPQRGQRDRLARSHGPAAHPRRARARHHRRARARRRGDRHRQGQLRRLLRHEPGDASCAVAGSTRWSSPASPPTSASTRLCARPTTAGSTATTSPTPSPASTPRFAAPARR